MPRSDILRRLQKLREIARDENANVNEAAAAAALMTKLMLQHKIKEAELGELHFDLSDEDPLVLEEILHDLGQRRVQTWQYYLLDGIALVHTCQVTNAPSRQKAGIAGRVYIGGEANDVATVRYIFDYVVREINRLCGRWAGDQISRSGRTAFRMGAAYAVVQAIQDERKKFGIQLALVKSEKKVTDFMEQMFGEHDDKKLSLPKDRSSFAAGIEAGQTIRLAANGGALGEGRLAINGG